MARSDAQRQRTLSAAPVAFATGDGWRPGIGGVGAAHSLPSPARLRHRPGAAHRKRPRTLAPAG